MVSKDPGLFPQLIAGLWSEDPLVRMRAADAAEKVTRENHEFLQPYKKELLGLMAETKAAGTALASGRNDSSASS